MVHIFFRWCILYVNFSALSITVAFQDMRLVAISAAGLEVAAAACFRRHCWAVLAGPRALARGRRQEFAANPGIWPRHHGFPRRRPADRRGAWVRKEL